MFCVGRHRQETTELNVQPPINWSGMGPNDQLADLCVITSLLDRHSDHPLVDSYCYFVFNSFRVC